MSASPSLRPPDIRPRTHAGAARLAFVVLGLIGLAGGFPRRCAAQAEDLSGRVVDKAGVGVSGAKVWAIGGDWEHPRRSRRRRPTTGAASCCRGPGSRAGPEPSRFLNVFARAGDGRIGWRSSIW